MKWKVLAVASLLINLGFASFDFVWKPYQETRIREHVGKLNGHFWELLTDTQRQFFMMGYLFGYPSGHIEACSTAATISEPRWTEEISGRCYDAAPNYSKPVDYYVEQLTRYYEHYPEDKWIGIFLLSEQFSDQKNRSFEEIHRRSTNREPL